MLRKQYIFLLLAFLSVAAVIVAVQLPVAPESTADPEPEFATNFSVRGLFRDYYYEHGALEIFGNPLTTAFMENGRRVQYFQNLCLEYIETTEKNFVQLCSLGQRANIENLELAKTNGGEPLSDASAQNTIGYDFDTLYAKLGGEEFLGAPVSDAIEYPDGRVEQYFLNAKFSYDPSDPNPHVTLAPLGELHVTKYGYLMKSTAFQPSMDASVDDIGRLHVAVSVEHTLCDPTFEQVVTIIVTRVNGDPVYNAQVEVWFTDEYGNMYPDAHRIHNVNENGYTQARIPAPRVAQGEFVYVNVEATYGTAPKEVETTYFEIWTIR